MDKPLVTVVAPAYNEEEVVNEFYSEMTKILSDLDNYNYEILIVNDGSKDKTEPMIKEICAKDKKVSFVNLSRNYGHEIAVAAGLKYAKGDIVILMDIDLQDTPAIIPDMIKKYEEGYDIVNAKRKSRDGETFMKKLTAKYFYKILHSMSGKVKVPRDVGNYRLASRRAVDAFNELAETHRFARGLFTWIGYPTTEIEFERDPRLAGETKYNYRTMINYAIEGITSFSTAPLRLATYFGMFVSLAAFVYLIVIVATKAVGNNTYVSGWASMMAVILFLGGIQLLSLGIIGEYVGRIFNETKNRPLYFVENYISSEEK